MGAISEALEPRMRLTGEMATLQKFNVSPRMQCTHHHAPHTCAWIVECLVASLHCRQIQCLYWCQLSDVPLLQSFFQSKQSLEKGTVITLLWRPEGVLEILLRESDEGLDYSRVCTSFHTAAVDLCLLLARTELPCRVILKHLPFACVKVCLLVYIRTRSICCRRFCYSITVSRST